MSDYKDLILWKKAHKTALQVLNIVEAFPKNNLSEVISKQVIRSATSVPANIAEGYGGRKGKEFISYLYHAKKSLTETDYWLLLSFEKNLLSQKEYSELSAEYVEILKLLNATLSKVSRMNKIPNP